MPFIPLAALAALSGYGLYLSYQNITRLQKYEEQSEKAAKWSNTVADRLHQTRTTQTSGTLTLLISFLSTVYLLLPTTTHKFIFVSAALLNAAVLFASSKHMSDFWNDSKQVQVPFVEKFNEAIKGSETVVRLLVLIASGWAGAGALWLVSWGSVAVWIEVLFIAGFGAFGLRVLGGGSQRQVE